MDDNEPTDRPSWVTERYWPGVTESQALAALGALRQGCATVSADSPIEFLGGIYFPDDDMLTMRFTGSRIAVVAAHEVAGCSFDRLTRAIELSP